jgi:hypothetical protein
MTAINFVYRRVPAEVRCLEKDSFVLHVPRKGFEGVVQVNSDSALKASHMVKALFGTSKGDKKDRKVLESYYFKMRQSYSSYIFNFENEKVFCFHSSTTTTKAFNPK